MTAPVVDAIEIADDFTCAGTNGFAASRALALDYLDYPVFAAVGGLKIIEGDDTYIATGTLLNSEWVLTAAHTWDSMKVTALEFCLGDSTYNAVMSSLVQHPLWTTTPVGPSQGWDVALFRLTTPITNSIVYPQLYTRTDELGKTGFTLGAGLLGTGTVPWYGQTNSPPLVYAAANVIDRTTAQTSSVDGVNYTGGLFVNDFDGTNSSQNTLGISYNTNTPVNPWVWGTSTNIVTLLDPAGVIAGTNSAAGQFTGTGGNILEGATAPGDSGGPTFLFDEQTKSWKLAGVTSWGYNPWDGSQGGDSFSGLYGDVNYFTRISQSSMWIMSQIPEPSTYGLLAVGVAAVSLAVSRRRKPNRQPARPILHSVIYHKQRR